jgi:hypothetical protein
MLQLSKNSELLLEPLVGVRISQHEWELKRF